MKSLLLFSVCIVTYRLAAEALKLEIFIRRDNESAPIMRGRYGFSCNQGATHSFGGASPLVDTSLFSETSHWTAVLAQRTEAGP